MMMWVVNKNEEVKIAIRLFFQFSFQPSKEFEIWNLANQHSHKSKLEICQADEDEI